MYAYAHYGKQNYFTAVLPETAWAYSYSASQLQAELNERFSGQRLTGIYLDLYGYLESKHSEADVIDLTDMGGSALILFETAALQLLLHVEGMLQYRWLPINDIKLYPHFGCPPDDMLSSDRYFADLRVHKITYPYQNATVDFITVKGTADWGFSQSDFDEEIAAAAAAQKHDLPTEVIFHTGGCEIRFIGDTIEYFWIVFDPPKPRP